jgi:hypothetical protein
MPDSKQIIKEARRTGFDLETGFKKIGFVLKDVSAGQLPYTCIQSCNSWLDNNFGTNISLFCYDHTTSCVNTKFARFHVKEIDHFVGDLIATSIDSALLIKNNTRAKRYYYINDFDWTRPNFTLPIEYVDKIFNDNDIVKFCRSRDHRDRLIKEGYKILYTIVEDFDIKTILEITKSI